MKTKNKRGKKAMIIIGIILGVIALLMLIGFIINTVFYKDELKTIKPYGQMVEVNGSKMHVYSMGNAKKTIVLLPGFGVALPSADFGPLMRKLSENYTIVTVEYFGTGFSEQSDTPRTNENYMNEVRTALDKAGFKPPYILMPHSASGVYSEYYAAKHPDEIAAIIMLDTTSTAAINNSSAPSFLYSIAKFQQAIGLTRLLTGLVPDTKLAKNGYTVKEISDYKLFSYHAVNNTMIHQSDLLMENIKEVNKLAFPKDIPVFKIISTQTLNGMAKMDKDDGMGYQNAHLGRLGENTSYKVIDATHFVYQTKSDEIARLTEDFLNSRKISH